jgi:hypothetical protein
MMKVKNRKAYKVSLRLFSLRAAHVGGRSFLERVG